MLNEKDKVKKLVGEASVEYIKDGMNIGLGSGSTVYWMVKKLGKLVEVGLDIKGIPSSNQTAEWAEQFGVSLTDFSHVKQLDLTIDGADEVDQDFQLIKGGGGALFREKVIAAAAKELIIIVDKSKMVTQLGKYPLPIEVLPFGWQMTANEISRLGCVPQVRKKAGGPVVTDNGNYILDCPFKLISNPRKLDEELKRIVGVVETGLFIGMADKIIVGDGDGIRTMNV
ncbi:ribose 5-phosphate isomerase A [Virgibacillus profundi]|uniref:Ribose-5-phosphate isomerase A n=1 Tax=Virgibacillus profundi TaxID=2024555 RepID=A0A2A2IHT8_9BACI|nr:ribose-5-phosphate isomerase RpiA [Virgibacillus profundi]PAV30918.1 ribose 5-phosphate isomerase A [Virgibacillus profundi]PXY55103.1 ribose-5-phosphate isomerase RpiA [Virgibacillus profundi]